MVVRLGSLTLNNVLNWEEEEIEEVPIKRPMRADPAVQSTYFIREPRRIIITTKLNNSEKIACEALEDICDWQELYDYDDSFVDYVWIEKVKFNWRGDEDKTYPWLTALNLICSQT